MMNELRELYQEVILDHNRHPRHFRKLANANHSAEGFNPLCGDRLSLYLQIDHLGVITDVGFIGTGCAISVASASLMSEALPGKTIEEAETLFRHFHAMIMNTDDSKPPSALGKLMVLAGVKEFPARIKCATLAWHTLHAALENRQQPVSTE